MLGDMTDRATRILNERWGAIEAAIGEVESLDDDGKLTQLISDCVNSATKSYRYVLPTQLLAKLEDPTRDCRAIQEGSKLPGSFDARSLCSRVIVPFDRRHHDVLGGSGDPYVNNPLRIPDITEATAQHQRNRADFEKLRQILDAVEASPDRCEAVFDRVLIAIRHRLRTVHVQYPLPNRLSLDDAELSLDRLLEQRTGGRRLQAVSVALFDAVGEVFGLFQAVHAGRVNRADAAAGDVADLDCRDQAGRTVLSVEVKDRRLTLRDAEGTLRAAREANVKEILFLLRGDIDSEDNDAFEQTRRRQFAAGHNVYTVQFHDFLRTCLILFGETHRRTFFERIGSRLDEFCELEDREAWAGILINL